MTQDTDEKEAKQRARKLREEQEAMLSALADECLRRNTGKVHAATQEMAEKIRQDVRLRPAALGWLLEQSCHDLIRAQVRTENQKTWHRNPDLTGRGYRLRSAAAGRSMLRLLDYSLIGGLPLRKAKRPEVIKNAEFQDKQSVRMGQTALWLGLIADALPDENTEVETALSEEQLRELQSQAIGYYGRETVGGKNSKNSG